MRQLPKFASGVIITCPAPVAKGYKGACAVEVKLNRQQWANGDKGYCKKHKQSKT